MDIQASELFAVSALDGRYRDKLTDLGNEVSEGALILNRVRVEAAWLLHLAEESEIGQDLKLPLEISQLLQSLVISPPRNIGQRVKDLERSTNHDVKAIEYYLREQLAANGADARLLAFIHFACTSEDINNLAYGIMLNRVRESHLMPIMCNLVNELKSKALSYADIAMLSRTHGQTASPTTLGKELAVFVYRLQRQIDQLAAITITGKMSGAVGNYNAHLAAYPQVDWVLLARTFIEKLGLRQNPLTTQIESHDTMVEYLDAIRRFNVILLGLCRDIWSYISIGYFSQKSRPGEVGSSTMPHKINPIDFENGEGNLGIAISLAQHFGEKLPISRWQRDLSDSTVQRALGTMFGHSLIAYKSILKGLDKIVANEPLMAVDLDQAWEVLAEPVQTIMRRCGVMDAYEQLKEATRGQKVTQENLAKLVDDCAALPAEVKEEIKAMTPRNYIGLARKLVQVLDQKPA